MNDPRNVPILSPAEAEEFYTSGTQAWPPEQGPGPAQSPDSWPKLSKILTQLIFASRALAMANLVDDTQFWDLSAAGRALLAEITRCAECQMAKHRGVQPHTSVCRTGRVLGLIAQLTDLPSSSTSERKELAREEACAEAGTLPRGAPEFNEPWIIEAEAELLYQANGELVFDALAPNFKEVSILQRIAACVNFLAGVSSEQLLELRSGPVGAARKLP